MNTPALTCTTATIEALLGEALEPTTLEVIDESADHIGHAGSNGQGFGGHFRIRVASPKFAGTSRVAQHRLVYDPLQPLMAIGLHAIAIEVLPTP